MAIPRDFINDLVARIDLVELINSRVKLKKAGKNYSACCPFHGEKTPSFSVSPEKQFYHCFGCGAHGNAVDFVMEYDRLGFVETIEELASLMGLEVPKDDSSSSFAPKISQDNYQLMHRCVTRYQQHLTQSSNSEQVLNYLTERGLSQSVIERFNIGYALDSWSDVSDSINAAERTMLVELGQLISNDNGRIYDRFRHRIMFPIRDRRGRFIGFGGRVLDDSTPKYLNSPESKIFHKGRELYGMYEALQHNRSIERFLIVEGYMDVVALAQYDINYAVASLGTSTTSEQIQLLFRNSKEVICCYDGDNAGKKAAWRTLENALPLLKPGQSLRFMFLPDGDDPDSYVRQHGKDEFHQQERSALTLSQFMFKELEQRHNVSDGGLAKAALDLIGTVNEPLLKETLHGALATHLRLNNVEELYRRYQVNNQIEQSRASTITGRGTPLREAMALAIQHPELGYQLAEQPAIAQLDMPGISLLVELLSAIRTQTYSSAQLIEHFRESPQFPLIKKLAAWPHNISDENLEAKFKAALIWLNHKFLEASYEKLQQKSLTSPLTSDEKVELVTLLKILQSKS